MFYKKLTAKYFLKMFAIFCIINYLMDLGNNGGDGSDGKIYAR